MFGCRPVVTGSVTFADGNEDVRGCADGAPTVKTTHAHVVWVSGPELVARSMLFYSDWKHEDTTDTVRHLANVAENLEDFWSSCTTLSIAVLAPKDSAEL